MAINYFFNKHNYVHLVHQIDKIAKVLVRNFLPKNEFGLYGGNSGIILFLLYYSKFSNNVDIQNIALNKLKVLVDEIQNNDNLEWVIDGGLSGLGFTIEHLTAGHFIDANTNEILSDTDEYFYKVMSFLMWNGNYDYLHGALGIGLYILTRSFFEKQKDYLTDLVGILYKKRIKIDKKNIAWKTLTIDYDGDEKFGFDFGMAHGLAGIVMMLTKLYIKKINLIKVRLMLEPLINFILKMKNHPSNISVFPNKIVDISRQTDQTSRLAWCYGDLGISVAIWHASQALGRKDWGKGAVNILLHSAKRRDLKENGVVDAGLCHGTAGISHIFNRMYGYTGLEELEKQLNTNARCLLPN